MAKQGDRIDVILETETLPDGSVRVHFMGVHEPGHPQLHEQQYDTRNVIQTWLGCSHDVHAFLIDNREGD